MDYLLGLALGLALAWLQHQIRQRRRGHDAAQLISALESAPIGVQTAGADGRVLACAGGAIGDAAFRESTLLGQDLGQILQGAPLAVWRDALAGREGARIHPGAVDGPAKSLDYLTLAGPTPGGGAWLIAVEVTAPLAELRRLPRD